MASASQVHPKRLRRHQKPREPLIFKGFPGLFCIKVERVLDPASGSQKQRSKYTDPFSRLSNQSTPVSIQLSATQFAPIDDTFSSEQILSKKESNGQTGIQKPCEIRFRDQKVAGSNPVTSTTKIRICESKSGFFVPHFWSNRIQADNPPFGCNRMTTDKGG